MKLSEVWNKAKEKVTGFARYLTGKPKKLPQMAPRNNHLHIIHPYYYDGLWVFDDVGLDIEKEALVGGMPEIIEMACREYDIFDPANGFRVMFCKDPFPGWKIKLDWVREESGGNVYRRISTGQEGWLCPVLFSYFDERPDCIYIDIASRTNRE